MGADAVVIRHHASGAPHRLAHSGWIRGSVVNAGDGTHEHPTQALLDAFTMRRHLAGGKGDLEGRRVTIVGDVLHSRVARSNVLLLATLGAEVTLVAPPTLLPVGRRDLAVRDVVRPRRAPRGRRRRDDAARAARADERRVLPERPRVQPPLRPRRAPHGALPDHAIVMHPGPMNRGMEIAAEVADSPRSVIVEQVANGVSVRMAVLYLLLGGADRSATPTRRPDMSSTTYVIRRAQVLGGDPADLVLRDGVIAEIAAAGAASADGATEIDADRAGRPARPRRPAHPPARARPRGRRDRRDRQPRGRGRRLHRRVRDGQHRPGRRHRGHGRAGLAARPRGRARRRAAGRRRHRRPRRPAARRARRDGRRAPPRCASSATTAGACTTP